MQTIVKYQIKQIIDNSMNVISDSVIVLIEK